jgi:hypothetical protein
MAKPAGYVDIGLVLRRLVGQAYIFSMIPGNGDPKVGVNRTADKELRI